MVPTVSYLLFSSSSSASPIFIRGRFFWRVSVIHLYIQPYQICNVQIFLYAIYLPRFVSTVISFTFKNLFQATFLTYCHVFSLRTKNILNGREISVTLAFSFYLLFRILSFRIFGHPPKHSQFCHHFSFPVVSMCLYVELSIFRSLIYSFFIAQNCRYERDYSLLVLRI